MDRVTLLACITEAEAMAQQCFDRGLYDEWLGAQTVVCRLTELFEQAVDAACRNMEAA